MKKRVSGKLRPLLYITIPIIVLFFLFNTLPLLMGIFYSFTDYRGYGTWQGVGLSNYIDLFTDRRVAGSYLFTFKYAVFGTVLVNILSLLLALGLRSKIGGKDFLRSVYFLPNILGGLIVGYIFGYIFTYILPALGKVLHLSFLSESLLASEKTAWIGVLIVGVWQAVALNTVIYMSGLSTIPAQMYEAGMVDGASARQRFFRLTLPMLLPFVSINLVLSGKNLLMVFDQIIALTGGGPAQSTESISFLIYKNGLSGGQFGFQSANAVLFFAVIVGFSLLQMIISGRKEQQL